MPSFLVNTCQSEQVSFFTSGNYVAGSFSNTWFTRNSPDNEGLNTPVYLLVLQKFGIPASFPNGTPPGGTLPGIDIKRMNAIDAIRLSLAESLLNDEWWDVYEDGEGGVFFQRVFDGNGATKFVNLDVRLCFPSVAKTNEVDMVVVRGYQYPPRREVREFRDVVPAGTGTINPTNVTGSEKLFTVAPSLYVPTCLSKLTESIVYKSYKDPVFTDEFNPQEPNPFYNVGAFESLTGYVHRITGMPTNPADAARVTFSLSDTTPWYKEITFPQFASTTTPACAGDLPAELTYFESRFQYSSPDFRDRYGDLWPLVKKPTGIFYIGNKLIELVALGNIGTIAYIDPVKEFNGLESGSSWIWNVQGRGEYEIVLFFQPKMGPEFWEAVLDATTGNPITLIYSDGQSFSSDRASQYVPASAEFKLLGTKSDIGYVVERMYLALELDRPCAIVRDAEGDAITWASSLRIEYAPMVMIKEPAPIAYYHKDEGGHIVDQTDGIVDNDPTTCQNFEISDLERMQDLMQGNVIDVSLPFCADGTQCTNVARMIFDYMSHESVQTYNLTCGPNDEPELGAGVVGFPSSLVIETINYSYADGSSYNINVTLGPIFANIGSWNNGGWIRQRQDVSRSAIIRWVAGDGVNYRVEVQGLGMFNAINGTDSVFYPGEVVQVTVFNIPVEQ